jgi:hypothetical protein
VLAVTYLGSDLSKIDLMREVNKAGRLGSRGSRSIRERRSIGARESLFDRRLNLQARLQRQDIRLSYADSRMMWQCPRFSVDMTSTHSPAANPAR